MQSKQTHTTTTPAHLEDDPCDNWVALGQIAPRVIDDYAPDTFEDAADEETFVRTFTRFMGIRQ